MAFFQGLIADLERKRDAPPLGSDYFAFRRKSGATSQQTINAPKEVLQFAPKEIRRHHQTAEDRINQLETEIEQWQDRAGRAETRLQFIEKSIQKIAAGLVRSAPRK
ncbi:MAG TPA: hypothetical protein VLN61_06045 [Pseudolabrys sp.]|nr:hypothetical protein [Pseudolabrys sp.]